jgi:hypothetical protein
MHRTPLSLAALVLLVSTPMLACLQQVSTGNGTGDDTSAAAAATATSAATAAATGIGCSTDPSTGISLCQQVSTCPGVVVDQGALSGCGFRLHGGAVLDLECLCGDALCPIGVPDTCAQASQLVSQTTSLTVCQESADSRCTQLTTTTSPTTTSTAASSSCDRTCETECAGEPDCIQLCGC